jgi:flavin reductase (DIM6/NTAB) family NADH-FMN oxidoreductase RutF
MQKNVDFDTAVKTKYPEQLVIAVAKDKKGKANPITLGWTMIASGEPAMLAIAVHQGHYSVGTIRHSKCFTVSYPSAQMADAALFFGKHSGRDTDKFAKFPCKTSPAVRIDSLLLDDAVANFECGLVWEKQAGDHIIFIGEVIACHINTEPVKRLYTLGPGYKLGAVSQA